MELKNVMDEIIGKLGNEIGIFIDNGVIDISVMETNANEVQKILDKNHISYQMDDDLYPVYNFTF